jgi:LytS/YehU family sensor histidine kinase
MAEAKQEKYRYFKLGDKASTFTDPRNGLFLVNNEVKRIQAKKLKSPLTKAALEGGHIVEVDQAAHTKYVERHRPEVTEAKVAEVKEEKAKLSTKKKKKAK